MYSTNSTGSGPARAVALLVLALTAVGAVAQQAPVDIATLRAKAGRLGNEARRAEQEVSFTEESILRLDTDIEQRIGALVDLIAKSKDSAATDDRIATCRAAAVAGLRRTLALYVAEREQRRQHGWDTSRLDQRIDLRLQQMATLAASYGPADAAGSQPDLIEDREMEEALGALKAGQFVGHVVQTREELVRELQAAVELLTARRDTLTLQLAVTTDPAEKETLQKEIAFAEALADKRRAQVAHVLAAPEQEGAIPVGLGTVSEIEKALRTTRQELRVSLMRLQKLATTRDYQQKRAEYLRKQQAETKAAMEQMTNPQQP